jgi:Tfp pilus assembly protein PilP
MGCKCVLYHVGKAAWPGDSDFAPIEKVVEALQSYDTTQSPYPFSEDEKRAMIAYAQENAPNGKLHSETLEYFWDEKG